MSWNRPKSGVSAAEPARGRSDGGTSKAASALQSARSGYGASTLLYTLAPGAEKWYHIAILSVVL